MALATVLRSLSGGGPDACAGAEVLHGAQTPVWCTDTCVVHRHLHGAEVLYGAGIDI